jgi:DHA1 family multidrug resistance protein-like MFS transporter
MSAGTGEARRRGVAVLLANSALMSAGFFLLIPLLSVHLTQDAGFSGAAAGAVLAVRQLTQQGLMLFGGALADQIGYRPVIATGMLVRAVGFLGFGVADSLPVILASAIVAALGGALFEATGKAALAALAPPADRPRLFSLSALAGGLGTTVGPLLGVWLLRFSFQWVGIAAGGFFLVAAILSAALLPPLAAPGGSPPPLRRTLARVARDRRFILFTALLTGYWLLFNQIYISVPLRAVQVTGSAGVVGVLYAINAAAGLLLQYPLVRWATRLAAPPTVLAGGVLLMAGGLGLFAFVVSPPAALPLMCLGIVVFAAGRALVEPTKDVVTSELAPPESLAAYFGVSFLALAVGGSIGNYAGGWLYDVATALTLPALPWVVFFVLGAAVAMLLRAATPHVGSAGPAPRAPV